MPLHQVALSFAASLVIVYELWFPKTETLTQVYEPETRARLGTSQTLNPKPETRNPKPETRNPKPEARNPKSETLNPKPETRNPCCSRHRLGCAVQGTVCGLQVRVGLSVYDSG